MKATKFKRCSLNGQCMLCSAHAEGIALYPDGSEWKSCASCAKSLVRHGKIRKLRHDSLSFDKQAILELKPCVENQEKGIMGQGVENGN